jgi:hypothetical protein
LDPALDRAGVPERENDGVEAALAKALEEAAAAKRFDVVTQLAGELQARRLARGGVPTLPGKARSHGI